MNKRNIKSKGFSLVELIFAVMMLTVIVFGVLKLQTSNLALSNTQNNELQAHFLANQGAEIVKALGKGYLDTPPCASPCEIQKSGNTYSLVNSGGMDILPFERTVEFDDTVLTNAYKVTVFIEWTDSTGAHTAEAKRIVF